MKTWKEVKKEVTLISDKEKKEIDKKVQKEANKIKKELNWDKIKENDLEYHHVGDVIKWETLSWKKYKGVITEVEDDTLHVKCEDGKIMAIDSSFS